MSESRYLPYGEIRWGDTGPTDFGFTGQRNDSYIKLIQMGARWYDSQLGRFISPDTIIPDPINPQNFNRYAYVRNNPIGYRDPSGHCGDCLLDAAFITYDVYAIQQEGWTPLNTAALAVDVTLAFVPIATGGGPGLRLAFAGGETLSQAAVHLPAEVGALQGVIKFSQLIQGKQLPLPGFEDKKPNPGEAAEDWVSQEIGVPRNSGSNRAELKAGYFTSKTKARIPDFDPKLTPGKIVEVKDRAKVYLDNNLADFVEYARQNSLKVELWVREDSWLEPALKKLTEGDNPLVDLKKLYD